MTARAEVPGNADPDFSSAVCPIPVSQYPQITLAHGGGGKLMQDLVEKMFKTAFHNADLETSHDGAALETEGNRISFTTDSFVVRPLFFPGGDIGKLAVYGTVNDLSMCGAEPRYLSCGVILEEGLSMETLWKVTQSVAAAAAECSVRIVTGDTKVVEKGKGDGIFINTAGIGILRSKKKIHPHSVRAGDRILLSGDIGRHGIAVMAQREGLRFESPIESDAAPLWGSVQALLKAGIDVHCLRDLTRGGLGGSLNEIATSGKISIHIEEKEIHVTEGVRGACEMLGLDPLTVANEGRFIAFVPEGEVRRALDALSSFEKSKNSEALSSCGPRVIGEVRDGSEGLVTMRNVIGTRRVIDRIAGEPLPRIC